MKTQNVETTNSQWSWLYKIGGAAAFGLVLIILIQIGIFMVAAPPFEGAALDWFDQPEIRRGHERGAERLPARCRGIHAGHFQGHCIPGQLLPGIAQLEPAHFISLGYN